MTLVLMDVVIGSGADEFLRPTPEVSDYEPADEPVHQGGH
jgi:hypothetical protein